MIRKIKGITDWKGLIFRLTNVLFVLMLRYYLFNVLKKFKIKANNGI